jgi:uncharacterized protein (TIGR00255 family)
MIKSMTGFGRGEATDGIRTVNVEIKAVNHRYAELNVRMPRRYFFAEDTVRKTVKEGISRGKLEISINVQTTDENESGIQVDISAAKQYFKALRELQSSFDVQGDISLEMLATHEGIIISNSDETDEDEITGVIKKATESAVLSLNTMRENEAQKLAVDMLERIDTIDSFVDIIEARAPEIIPIYAKKLADRAAELASIEGDIEIREERISIETALFADKSNVTEEIVRLRSHTSQFRKLLSGSGKDNTPIGKKLDFIIQEMNRETNTIGSKAHDLQITNLMLDLKSEIEKIREQVQNIE